MSTDEHSAARLRHEEAGLVPEAPASEPPTGSRPRPVLASLLIESGLVTGEQIQAAVVEGARTGVRFGEVLLRQGAVSEGDLARALAEQWGIPFVERPELAPGAAHLIPADQARQDGVLAIGLDGEGRSVVALVDPTRELIEQVESLLGSVAFVVVTQTEFERLLGETASPSDAPIPVAPTPAAPVTTTTVTAPREPPARDPSRGRPRAQPAEPEGAELLSELGKAEARLQELGTTMESIAAAIRAAEEQARALAETREKLAAAETRVAELAGELETERGRSDELTAELESRDELFATLRAKLSELSGALGTGP